MSDRLSPVYYEHNRKGQKKWKAELFLVNSDGKYRRVHLGRFYSEKKAWSAYNKAINEWRAKSV
jgi:hypothetical protein